jgi:hypothetical protein
MELVGQQSSSKKAQVLSRAERLGPQRPFDFRRPWLDDAMARVDKGEVVRAVLAEAQKAINLSVVEWLH